MNDGILFGKLLKAAKHFEGKRRKRRCPSWFCFQISLFLLERSLLSDLILKINIWTCIVLITNTQATLSLPFPWQHLSHFKINLHEQLIWFPPDLLIPHSLRDYKELDQIFISSMNSDYLPDRKHFWLRNRKTGTQCTMNVSAPNANFIFTSN